MELGSVLKMFFRSASRDYERERVYRQEVFFAPRSRSYWCSECDTIGGDAKRCPRCESTALLNVGRVLPLTADGAIRLEAV